MLEKGTFRNGVFSKIALTNEGVKFVEDVLQPLWEFAGDINRVTLINGVKSNLRLNPGFFQDMYPEVAKRYRETSPHVNADPEGKKNNTSCINQ